MAKERANSEIARDGVQPGVAIEFVVLAGVKNVEARDPEGHGGGEQQYARIERTAHRDPGGRGRDAQRKPKHQVRPAREAFGVGVQQHDGQRHGRKIKRQAIQLRRREDEDRAGNDHENRDECRMSACRRAGHASGCADWPHQWQRRRRG